MSLYLFMILESLSQNHQLKSFFFKRSVIKYVKLKEKRPKSVCVHYYANELAQTVRHSTLYTHNNK